MGAWVHGCVGAWVRGCMGAWVHGCMGAWVGAADIRINTPDLLGHSLLDLLDPFHLQSTYICHILHIFYVSFEYAGVFPHMLILIHNHHCYHQCLYHPNHSYSHAFSSSYSRPVRLRLQSQSRLRLPSPLLLPTLLQATHHLPARHTPTTTRLISQHTHTIPLPLLQATHHLPARHTLPWHLPALPHRPGRTLPPHHHIRDGRSCPRCSW